MSRVIFAVAAFGLAAVCFAQRTSELNGRVTDASQAVIANAAVTVTNVDTRVERTTVSNDLGYYTVPLLPPGNYQITVQHEGFRPITHSGITLVVDQTARVDFVLQVGAVTEKVEVTANASVVETQSSTLKGVVDEQRIRELPLNGRDAGQLILLMPGVYGTTDTSGLAQGGSGRGIIQPGISSNGARGNMVNYSLDGAYHNDGYTNVSLPIPDPDALQEFSVQTNGFSAEYGRNAGGIVNAVTRSGTNALHGTLFEFHRNAAVNALSFFSTASDGLKRNQFGGTLGGPV
jgi:outer membrane receptor protein involved in Fe transport